MNGERPRHEFTAIIEGIELPPETVERLNQAVQKAVLTEIANVDMKGSISLEVPESDPAVMERSTRGPIYGLTMRAMPRS